MKCRYVLLTTLLRPPGRAPWCSLSKLCYQKFWWRAHIILPGLVSATILARTSGDIISSTVLERFIFKAYLFHLHLKILAHIILSQVFVTKKSWFICDAFDKNSKKFAWQTKKNPSKSTREIPLLQFWSHFFECKEEMPPYVTARYEWDVGTFHCIQPSHATPGFDKKHTKCCCLMFCASKTMTVIKL